MYIPFYKDQLIQIMYHFLHKRDPDIKEGGKKKIKTHASKHRIKLLKWDHQYNKSPKKAMKKFDVISDKPAKKEDDAEKYNST